MSFLIKSILALVIFYQPIYGASYSETQAKAYELTYRLAPVADVTECLKNVRRYLLLSREFTGSVHECRIPFAEDLRVYLELNSPSEKFRINGFEYIFEHEKLGLTLQLRTKKKGIDMRAHKQVFIDYLSKKTESQITTTYLLEDFDKQNERLISYKDLGETVLVEYEVPTAKFDIAQCEESWRAVSSKVGMYAHCKTDIFPDSPWHVIYTREWDEKVVSRKVSVLGKDYMFQVLLHGPDKKMTFHMYNNWEGKPLKVDFSIYKQGIIEFFNQLEADEETVSFRGVVPKSLAVTGKYQRIIGNTKIMGAKFNIAEFIDLPGCEENWKGDMDWVGNDYSVFYSECEFRLGALSKPVGMIYEFLGDRKVLADPTTFLKVDFLEGSLFKIEFQAYTREEEIPFSVFEQEVKQRLTKFSDTVFSSHFLKLIPVE